MGEDQKGGNDSRAKADANRQEPEVSAGQIGVLFRWPEFPVIVFGADLLAGARDRRELMQRLEEFCRASPGSEPKAVDATGEEFWFNAQHLALIPGFLAKIWTKRQLVELYNAHLSAGQSAYAPRSLSNKRRAQIVADIVALLSG